MKSNNALGAIRLVIMLSSVALLAAVGCSSGSSGSSKGCEDMCELAPKCGGEAPSDCKSACRAMAEVADEAGCSDELDAQNSCVEANNSCDGVTKCQPAVVEFGACMLSYCAAHPDACGTSAQ